LPANCKKIELCAQKIFKAFLAYGNQQKTAFCQSREIAVHKYVDEIDAWWQHGSKICFAALI